jgi:RNA polymerase sigma-70 factor (ECF subfamily)
MVIRENSKVLEDPKLVRSCVNGDEAALETLYIRYNTIILNHLYRMMQDRTAAEDLTEETFFRVWSKAALFDENKGSFKTWLFRMATRLAINRLKKKARRAERAQQLPLSGQEIADGSSAPDRAAGKSEAKEIVNRALQNLNEKDKAVLLLRHFEGLGEQDVARILGIPRGTVKSRTYYAVKRLKDALEGMGYTRNNTCR